MIRHRQLLLLCLFFGVVAVGFGLTTMVSAQTVATPAVTASPTSDPTASTAPVTSTYRKESIENDIEEVKRSYRGQLEEYRRLDQQYRVALQEWENLNTLSSLEQAVQATRKAMDMRDQVLLTYVELLRLELIHAEGINLTHKEIAVTNLEELKKALTRHKEGVQVANDRASINTAAQNFTLLSPTYVRVSAFSTSLLQLGKLQTIYDRSLTLKSDLEITNATSAAGLTQEENERALRQIENNLIKSQEYIDEADAVLQKSLDADQPVKLSREISDIFVVLTQVVRFLEEVASK